MRLFNWKSTALFAGGLWGGWAFIVNVEAGLSSAIISSLVQAALSAFSASLLALSMDRLLALRWHSIHLKRLASAMLPYSILLSIVVGVHLQVGTHNLLWTVLPANTIGFVYCMVYVIKNTSSRSFGSSDAAVTFDTRHPQ